MPVLAERPTTGESCGGEEVGLLRQRLHRISGQVLGLERMIADGRPCAEVLVQLAAAQGALRALGLQLLALHTRTLLDAVAAATASPAEVAGELTALATLATRTPGHAPSARMSTGTTTDHRDAP
ncbi:metal-sensitive transcriptional regulator [Amycolatopsis tucumanensis]|nr:metal-sensitive transcriptional regulator [Amycolatopsis tucumanensis]MCF6428504.1 metal-sensitive transcriptional regulator [Amycolatopsis tucumanensis]